VNSCRRSEPSRICPFHQFEKEGMMLGASPQAGSRSQKMPRFEPVLSSVPSEVADEPGGKVPADERDADLAVVVAQIAGLRAGAQVDLLAEIAVAQKTFVCLVAVAA